MASYVSCPVVQFLTEVAQLAHVKAALECCGAEYYNECMITGRVQ